MHTPRVFVFSPAYGLPSAGPFGLKLELWLRLTGIEYERCFEDDSRKGPKGKSPWIELQGELMGDTELIIARLSRERGVDLDAHLDTTERAIATSVTRMLEEHLHQVLEWELFVHPEGWHMLAELMDRGLPWALRPIVKAMVRGHYRRQLSARGVARHSPEQIAAMGRSDLDAVEALLGDGPYLFGEQPCTADTVIYGLIAPLVFMPAATPMMQHAKGLPGLSAYCRRITAHYFAEADASPQDA